MAWKNLDDTSFAQSLLIEHDAIKELDGIDELVDWQNIESMLKDIHSKSKGEKAWPPLMMFKALLLQAPFREILYGTPDGLETGTYDPGGLPLEYPLDWSEDIQFEFYNFLPMHVSL